MPLLYDALESAAKRPDRMAYSFEGREGTFQQLNESANNMARNLAKAGFQKGDHFAMLIGNSPVFIKVLYGIWKMGGVVIPINPTYTKNEIGYILRNANVKVVLTISAVLPVIQDLQKELEQLTHVYVTDEDDFCLLLDEGDGEFEAVPIYNEDTAIILYTSGTTGKPKGAMLTHENLYSNAVATGNAVEINETDVIINALPMFHIFALTVCVNMPIVKQAKMIIMPQFSPKQFLQLVKEHKVTFFGGVPTMYNFIYHFLKENPEGFSTITHCASGGASLPVALLENFKKDFGVTIQEGYGLSEGAGVVTLNPRKGEIKAGTVGVGIEDIETRIVNEEGQDVRADEVGELICKGPNVFKGYYQMPNETEKALRDGWLYTGDLARFDEDGYISIVDRKKDLIIVGGFNVYPREVEEVLYKHECVIEAGVVGEPDDEYGERVKAYVVTKEGLTEEELVAYCKEHLAPYKVPSEIHFRETLPKTSSGKILRRGLRN